LKVVQADARALPFLEGSFDVVLCFGVYHSLESGVELALAETFRVLRPGGRLCAEFRADSLHNRLIDICKGGGSQRNRFHKCNYEEHEARLLLRHAGFVIERGLAAFNMPILYHLPLLRHRSQRTYDEHVCRAEGYRLRPWVECLQDVALRLVPSELCNLWVYICRKP
jgi:SAM-dependent methyltransferase